MVEEKNCQRCGARIAPEDRMQGMCPTCLLELGMREDSLVVVTGHQTPAAPPPTPAELAPLFPQFEILDVLGQGGMGVVYKARQKDLDRLVALKVLPTALGRDPAFAERFSREAKALASLSHPNLVAVHAFGKAGDHLWFAMEFVDGLNLRQLIRREKVEPARALQIVGEICQALGYAHAEGVVHRDIKPENILIDVKGRLKITDFGLAKVLGDGKPDVALTMTHQAMGTPHYMAPEQFEHPESVDHRADIFSLGVVFYELLTGELPLGRFPVPSQKIQVDVRFDDVVLKALEKEPARRYQTVGAVATDVEGLGRARVPAQGRGERRAERAAASGAGSHGSERGGRPVWPWFVGCGCLFFVVVPMLLFFLLAARAAVPGGPLDLHAERGFPAVPIPELLPLELDPPPFEEEVEDVEDLDLRDLERELEERAAEEMARESERLGRESEAISEEAARVALQALEVEVAAKRDELERAADELRRMLESSASFGPEELRAAQSRQQRVAAELNLLDGELGALRERLGVSAPPPEPPSAALFLAAVFPSATIETSRGAATIRVQTISVETRSRGEQLDLEVGFSLLAEDRAACFEAFDVLCRDLGGRFPHAFARPDTLVRPDGLHVTRMRLFASNRELAPYAELLEEHPPLESGRTFESSSVLMDVCMKAGTRWLVEHVGYDERNRRGAANVPEIEVRLTRRPRGEAVMPTDEELASLAGSTTQQLTHEKTRWRAAAEAAVATEHRLALDDLLDLALRLEAADPTTRLDRLDFTGPMVVQKDPLVGTSLESRLKVELVGE